MTNKDYQHWRYVFRAPKEEDEPDEDERKHRSCEWAIVHVDSAGFFGAASDYGDYIFHWPPYFGECFRTFLVGIERDYFFGKVLGKREELDVSESKKNILKGICEGRRWNDISKEDARYEYDSVNDCHDEGDLKEWIRNQNIFEEAWEYLSYDWDSQAIYFYDKIMPRLKKAIKKQLEEEKSNGGTCTMVGWLGFDIHDPESD